MKMNSDSTSKIPHAIKQNIGNVYKYTVLGLFTYFALIQPDILMVLVLAVFCIIGAVKRIGMQKALREYEDATFVYIIGPLLMFVLSMFLSLIMIDNAKGELVKKGDLKTIEKFIEAPQVLTTEQKVIELIPEKYWKYKAQGCQKLRTSKYHNTYYFGWEPFFFFKSTNSETVCENRLNSN